MQRVGSSRDVRAIILAAGQGTRLRPHTDDRPKCLVEIAGSTILEHQLKNCLRNGIREAIIVTGFKWEVVDAHVAAWRRNGLGAMDIKTLYNPFWREANNLISLWSARHYMDREFVLINGDDVFDFQILNKLRQQNHYNIHVCVDQKNSYDDDDMKIMLDGDRVKAINKTMAAEKANGESIGIMKFTRAGAERLLSELEAMVRSRSASTDWYTKAIERIALDGYEIGAVSIDGLRWAEVDFPEDLEFVRQELSGLLQ